MSEARTAAFDVAPLFCARCSRELRPGRGGFFQVTIDAVADPYPPDLEVEVESGAIRAGIERLLQQLGDLSAQEAMDQVHRHLVMTLCDACFEPWFENPAGS